MAMKTSKFNVKIHDDNAKLKKVSSIMDGSWGMNEDHIGKHGRWAHGIKT
jgi:hypothetical protein